MKRVISITLVILMTAALLVGCGSSSGPEGSYVLKSMNGKNVEELFQSGAEAEGVSVEELLKSSGISKAEELITMELKSGGTAVMKEAIFGTTSNGTWKQDGSKIIVTIDGTDTAFTLSGNELSYSAEGQEYVLIKK